MLYHSLTRIAVHMSLLSLAAADSIVDLGYAKYAGNVSYPNTVAFLGIPYAEPPLADLRFRAPLPLNTTRIAQQAGGKVINASSYPEFCIQGTTGRWFTILYLTFFSLIVLLRGRCRGRW